MNTKPVASLGYGLEAGRVITREGQPFIYIGLCGDKDPTKRFNFPPHDADQLARWLVDALNAEADCSSGAVVGGLLDGLTLAENHAREAEALARNSMGGRTQRERAATDARVAGAFAALRAAQRAAARVVYHAFRPEDWNAALAALRIPPDIINELRPRTLGALRLEVKP